MKSNSQSNLNARSFCAVTEETKTEAYGLGVRSEEGLFD